MIFDTHTHLFKMLEDGSLDETELSTMIERMDRCGIDRALLLGAVLINQFPRPEQTLAINTHTIAAVVREPDRLSGMCYLNPEHDPEFNLEEMGRCIANGPLVGVKFWVALKADRDKEHDPIMRRCKELDCPILYHAWYKTAGMQPQESTPAHVAHLARRHPEVRIIMAHMMGGGIRGILDVADLPNVWIDTSGSQPEAGSLEYALQTIGADRIIFGSDMSGRDFATQRGKIEAVDMTDDERDAIYWRNLAHVLGRRSPC